MRVGDRLTQYDTSITCIVLYIHVGFCVPHVALLTLYHLQSDFIW